MLKPEKLEQFAELAVRVGANLQPGQEVALRCDVAAADFARVLAKKAYERGARRVYLQWRDEKCNRINMERCETEALLETPSYELERDKFFIEHRCCLISVSAGDPNIYRGCEPDKVARVDAANSAAHREFMKATMSNALRWTIVSVPTENWAKTVFPELSAEEAVDRLWEQIARVMRLDAPDPVRAWREHIDTLARRAGYLNRQNFDALRFTSSNGTDLTVGLAEEHVWLSAQETGQDGVPFTANMPTEEVFTAPHRRKAEGVVKNALPLVYSGNVIDRFSLTFEEGRVVSYSAEVGQDALKGLLSADEGALHLGEVALIGKRSPIAETGILFYNTLFDENASCHLALGKAYPTTVRGGSSGSERELEEMGVNDSLRHEDFMIGTEDLRVEGIRSDGTVVRLFEDGDWAI